MVRATTGTEILGSVNSVGIMVDVDYHSRWCDQLKIHFKLVAQVAIFVVVYYLANANVVAISALAFGNVFANLRSFMIYGKDVVVFMVTPEKLTSNLMPLFTLLDAIFIVINAPFNFCEVSVNLHSVAQIQETTFIAMYFIYATMGISFLV